MKRKLRSLLMVLSCLPFLASAQAVDTNSTVTWVFDTGAEGQTATFTEGTADYFSLDFVTLGSNLFYKAPRTSNSVNFTQFQPYGQTSYDATNKVGFCVRPKTGLTFTPTAVSFDSQRFGTGSGLISVRWLSPDGTQTIIEEEFKPARDNESTVTSKSYDLTSMSIPASEGECCLEIYIYDLGDTKQIGLANIVVTGQLSGTVIEVPSYTLSTSASPEEAGEVSVYPVGTEFDEGTEVNLTASKNFGYNFSHWADENDETVSTDNPFTFSMDSNMVLKAVYETLNTYALNLTVEGGANDYMITISPEGTMVDEQRLYEEGTTVSLSAMDNPILTFTNWGGGETSADYSVTMTDNMNVTAVYSAVDYVVGWDFYTSNNGGRSADFYSNTDNEASALVLRNANGDITTWLDKSEEGAGGYEGAPAAVNWAAIADNYYYQASVNAKDFTDLAIEAQLLVNYNAYSKYFVEYSLDGTTFTTVDTFNILARKVWYQENCTLPEEADHAEVLYIRWIPDYTSDLIGTESDRDGIAISGIYITGQAEIYDDGTAPVLVASVPAEGATNASATGKIVLSFDEKVQVTEGTVATLGEKELTPTVFGKSITFSYTSLDYNTAYTFTLPASTVSDLSGNTLTDAITIQFNTMNRPVVSKQLFDFIVGVDGDFSDALDAAQAASSTGKRFYIFFPDGEYNIGEDTGDDNQMTTISLSNVSYVGESSDSVIVFNESTQESISSTATMNFTSSTTGIYMQDISLMNKMDYRNGELKGRAAALCDAGTKSIYKNVKLLSNQDTYYTKVGRSYLETCEIHGTVDFICGGGDIFFNECLLYLEERSGNCITAPATSSDWGYVFNNCTIDGFAINDGSYRLGRPWSNEPKSIFINTTMNVLPTASAWGDPMNVVPAVFAEYNSTTASGSIIDLSTRRTTYTKDGYTVTLNPELTLAEAAQYIIENVVGQSDAWQPKLYTEQAEAPVISQTGNTLNWDDNDYVLCWGVFKNETFVEFVTTNSYDIPAVTVEGDEFTIRAANEMGGLGTSSNVVEFVDGGVAVRQVNEDATLLKKEYYTLQGVQIKTPDQAKGVIIEKSIYSNGIISTRKTIQLKL